jgi:hypothetical protein
LRSNGKDRVNNKALLLFHLVVFSPIPPGCIIDDYVLAARRLTGALSKDKLRVNWKGAHRVIEIHSKWLYEAQNLITGQTRKVHSWRLKFYQDGSLKITTDLKHQIAYNDSGYKMQEFMKVRRPEDRSGEWKVFVFV